MAASRKKVIEIVIGACVAIIVAFLVKQLINKPSFNKEMMNVASELNKDCPIMLDSETRLDNVTALPEKTFQYNYTLVNAVADSINVIDLRNYLERRILIDVKTNPDLEIFRDNGMTMSYNYRDKYGNFVLKIAITPDQYIN